MLESFVITLREGIEAFLIIAISLAYLRKTGKSHLIPAVHWGIAAAIGVSVLCGVLLQRAANQSLWEGVLATVAAVLVGSLTVQMMRQAKLMKTRIESQLRQSSERTEFGAYVGIFTFTVLMISREGMETALLINALLFQVKSFEMVLGAILGVGVAAGVARAWSVHGHRVNLSRFMQVTSIFLLVFVVQLLIYGFHELAEAHVLPSSQMLHDLTEPYGPDGRYGQLLSYALIALPAAWLLMSWWRDRRHHALPRN
jgi:high-affinity iron transporter